MMSVIAFLVGGYFIWTSNSITNYCHWVAQEKRVHAAITGCAVTPSRPWQRWFPYALGFSVGFLVTWGIVGQSIFFDIFMGCLGAALPWISLRELQIRRRRTRQRGFPDFLELMALSLSSGQNLEAAWKFASHLLPLGEFKQEVESVSTLFSMGRSKDESLREFKLKLDDPTLSSVVVMIEQGLEKGFPLQDILRDQARALRQHRLMLAERRAETIKIKILFPIVFLILPAFFIVILGPLILQYILGGQLF